MIEEVSEKKGPKPYIIDPMPADHLCSFFFGVSQIQEKKLITTGEAVQEKVSTPHFGASQVVIVRD